MNDSVSMPGHLRVGLGDAMPAANEHILSQVLFSTDQYGADSPQLWPLGLESLHGPVLETWYVDTAVRTHHINDFVVHDSAQWAWLGYEGRCCEGDDIAALAHDLFIRLQQTCQSIAKPHVARVWAVIPDIHHGRADQERYKQFCLGRHEAYQQLGVCAPAFPAATVIGGHTDILRLHVLSGDHAGQPVENPRQTSAYRYPREYGPRSPSFSRAMKLRDCTLVSGTAAIRGADSRHPADTAAQIREIAENLDSLRQASGAAEATALQYARLYLRAKQDLDTLRTASQSTWPHSMQWPVLHADICRDNLRCEIETVFPA